MSAHEKPGPPAGDPENCDLSAALLERCDRDLEKMCDHPQLCARPRCAPDLTIRINRSLFPEFRKALEVLDRETPPDAVQHGAARVQPGDVAGLGIEQGVEVTKTLPSDISSRSVVGRKSIRSAGHCPRRVQASYRHR